MRTFGYYYSGFNDFLLADKCARPKKTTYLCRNLLYKLSTNN